jgi:hypothetical protein
VTEDSDEALLKLTNANLLSKGRRLQR